MKKFSLIFFAALTTLLSAYGQGARNIKINEVMTSNKAWKAQTLGRAFKHRILVLQHPWHVYHYGQESVGQVVDCSTEDFDDEHHSKWR